MASAKTREKDSCDARHHISPFAVGPLLDIFAEHCGLDLGARKGKKPKLLKDARPQGVRFAKVDDVRIAYRAIGKGKPLILIMGYCGTMDLWDKEFIREMSRKRKLILFDNRGMGFSTSSKKKFSMELFANDAALLMDALKIGDADVLGWSMGTNIAQELALKYPEKVDRLVLYAPDCGGKEAVLPSIKEMWSLFRISDGPEKHLDIALKLLFPEYWLEKHPDPSRYVPRTLEKTPPESVKGQFFACLSWKGTFSRMQEIKSPTLLITGSQDIVTPPENTWIMAERIPHSKVVEIDGCGHGLMYQKPKEFSKDVLEFLDS